MQSKEHRVFKTEEIDVESGQKMIVTVSGPTFMPFWKHDLKLKAAITLLDTIDGKDFEDCNASQSFMDDLDTLYQVVENIKDESHLFRFPIRTEIKLQPEVVVRINEKTKEKLACVSIIANELDYGNNQIELQAILNVGMSFDNGEIAGITLDWQDKAYEQYGNKEMFDKLIEEAEKQNLATFLYSE